MPHHLPLPPARVFLDSVVASLAVEPSPTSAQAARAGEGPTVAATDAAAAEPMRPLLLTLHALFPGDVLPALDLLDRGLVRRLRTQSAEPGPSGARRDAASCTYVVQSAQRLADQDGSWHKRSADRAPRGYQVQLAAWNCTCPAFAFATVAPAPAPTSSAGSPLAHAPDEADAATVPFGGATLCRQTPPVCKHLLACELAERAGARFRALAVDATCSADEMAGWAAGWGD